MEVENKRQQEVQELLAELEEAAHNLHLKRRILDSIHDMREDVKELHSEIEWKKKIMEIDELIAYIRQSEGVDEQTAATAYGENVTEKEVMDRLSDILNRCYETNKLQNEIYEKGYRASAQEAERAMREMTNAEANFNEITHADVFCQSYQNIANCYGNQMDEAACRYVGEIADNYSTAVGKIRTMLSAFEYGGIGVTKKDLYQKWEKKQDSLKQKIREDVKSLEKGSSIIAEFGTKNIGEVQKIVEKNKKKCRNIKRTPLYVVLAVAVCLLIGGALMKKAVTDPFEIATDNIEVNVEGEERALLEFEMAATSKEMETAMDMILGELTKVLLLPIACAALIMVILCYFIIKTINKKYQKNTAKEVGIYLLNQTNRFWNQDSLKIVMEDSEEKIMRIADECYKTAVTSIFQGVFPQSKIEEGSKGNLSRICNEWEQIKRGI